jgi:hypothetical protein
MTLCAAPLAECRTYELSGITYVPHYFQPGIYVGPAGKTLSQYDLKNLQAQPTTTPLWQRNWTVQQQLQKAVA